MTGCASEVSDGGLCLCSYLWKNLQTVLMVINHVFTDVHWGVKAQQEGKGRSSNVIFVGGSNRDLAHTGGNMQFSTSSPATDPRVSRMLAAYSPHEIHLIVWPWVNVKLMNKMQNNNSMCKRNSAVIPIPTRQRIHLYIPVTATWFTQKQPVLHFVLLLTQSRDFWGFLMAADTLLVCGTKTGCV